MRDEGYIADLKNVVFSLMGIKLANIFTHFSHKLENFDFAKAVTDRSH